MRTLTVPDDLVNAATDIYPNATPTFVTRAGLILLTELHRRGELDIYHDVIHERATVKIGRPRKAPRPKSNPDNENGR